MGEFSPWHLLILAAVFVLLFGAKKLPDAARSMGRSLRIFKTEIKGLHEDDQQAPTDNQQVAPAALPAATPADPVTTAGQPTSTAGDRADTR